MFSYSIPSFPQFVLYKYILQVISIMVEYNFYLPFWENGLKKLRKSDEFSWDLILMEQTVAFVIHDFVWRSWSKKC